MKVQITRAKGYETGGGKYSRKSWVAQITAYVGGSFDRTFPEPVSRDWTGYKVQNRKGTWTETFALTPGAYEVVEFGEKSYCIVFERSGELRRRWVAGGDLTTALARMDGATLAATLGEIVTRVQAEQGEEAAKALTLPDVLRMLA